MRSTKKHIALALLSLSIPCAGMEIEIRPWPPASKAAVSITFDDAYNSHVRHAMPLLESHGFRGTFYLIVDRLIPRGNFLNTAPSAPIPGWQAGASRGHELASHTVSHPRLDIVDPYRVRHELADSKAILDSLFGGEPVVSLAYPFSRTNAAIAEAASLVYQSARGGEPEDGSALHNDPGSLDFMRLKGFFPCGPVDQWHDAVSRAIEGKGWLIESFHPIGERGWCSVTTANFAEHLDYLSRQGTDLWIAPVRDVVRRIRQWRTLEVEATKVSEEAYELRMAGSRDHPYDWQVALHLEGPHPWVVADEDGQVLASTMEGDALVFSWPRERAGEKLFLTRKDRTVVSRFGWGRLKKAVREQVEP